MAPDLDLRCKPASHDEPHLDCLAAPGFLELPNLRRDELGGSEDDILRYSNLYQRSTSRAESV